MNSDFTRHLSEPSLLFMTEFLIFWLVQTTDKEFFLYTFAPLHKLISFCITFKNNSGNGNKYEKKVL